MSRRILVVDDEESICVLLERVLVREGYRVLKTNRGQEALELLVKEKPDLMILDFNLPDLTGENIYEVARRDPRTRDIPILIITGRPVDGLAAKCLNGGADAFILKPFEIPELLAQVHALLRRSRVYLEAGDTIEKGGLAINPRDRSVTLNGAKVQHLSPKEFEVLKELVMRCPDVVGKSELAIKVWGSSIDDLNPRTLDVHIRRIRQKIGAPGARSLKTIPAVGYQWLAKS